MSIEQLENRVLLAVALQVNGTDSGDKIELATVNSTQFKVVNRGTTTITSNGRSVGAGASITYNYLDISTLTVDGRGGNDTLSCASGFVKAVTLLGGSGSDTLLGGGGHDRLIGDTSTSTGNDILKGNGGNDTIFGGLGNDDIYGGAGADKMYGDGGSDRLHNDDGTKDTVSGGDGNDYCERTFDGDVVSGVEYPNTLYGTANTDGFRLVYVGGDGPDTISITRSGSVTTVNFNGFIDTYPDSSFSEVPEEGIFSILLFGRGGNDRITVGAGMRVATRAYGDDGNDSLTNSDDKTGLYGGPGNDTLTGGGSSDFLYGGNGRDSLSGNGGNDTLTGDGRNYLDNDNLGLPFFDPEDIEVPGDDTLSGGSGNDRIEGRGGNDSLRGGDGNDSLYGGDGNDTLNGEGNSDLMSGGTGSDTVDYRSRTSRVVVTLDGVTNDGAAPEGSNSTTEFDNVLGDVDTILGGSGNDDLRGRERTANRIDGGGGNDLIKPSLNDDDAKFSTGTVRDTLIGGSGNDNIDAIFSRSGHSISGGDGNDTIRTGVASDTVDGGAGADTISYTNRGANLFVSLDGIANDGQSGENDSLTSIENFWGGSGADTFTGDGNNNSVKGGGGNDTLRGGGGNDTLSGEAGNDSLDGGTGNDRLLGGDGNDTLIGNDGLADTLDGGLGTDKAKRDSIDVLLSIEGFL
ncbi:MAG TPA: calcium-binding protein [Tepidisphaeraceae bacterium]|nr:calcium-binding protein [Tepidisphaeraceae bacterium]